MSRSNDVIIESLKEEIRGRFLLLKESHKANLVRIAGMCTKTKRGEKDLEEILPVLTEKTLKDMCNLIDKTLSKYEESE